MADCTVDDLSNILQHTRIARLNYHDRILRKSMPKGMPKRNDINGTLDYLNKRFCLGITYYGLSHMTEDARACILHDLAHQPLDMVLERLKSEGAVLE